MQTALGQGAIVRRAFASSLVPGLSALRVSALRVVDLTYIKRSSPRASGGNEFRITLKWL